MKEMTLDQGLPLGTADIGAAKFSAGRAILGTVEG